MTLEGTSIVGFGRARAAGKAYFALNPGTGKPLEPAYYWASLEDLERATALSSGVAVEFSRWAPSKRAALLRRIAELIETNGGALIERANLETALPLARLQGEIARTCGQLRLFATVVEEGLWRDARIDHADANRKPVPKPDVRSMLVALGPVAVFSSSNFPFAFSVAGGDTASALAAGCPVIVKPHQGHLGVSEMVGTLVTQACRDTGAPEGTFSMLYGKGREIGMDLVFHPSIKAVGFTGSREGGRALMDAAAARPAPIPVYAEMGSINPVFMLPGAVAGNLNGLASGLHASVTLGVGQFCTNPGLVFLVGEAGSDPFIQTLTDLFTASAPGTMLTSSICEKFNEGIEKFAAINGIRKLAPAAGTASAASLQARPTLFLTDAQCFVNNACLLDEVFGPSTILVRCPSLAEALVCARKLDGQLTATLHATPEDLKQSAELVVALQEKAGRLLCNGFPTGVEVCHAMNHGGPYPATADGRSTSVGTRAIFRFARPVCFQNFPDAALPPELQESNPLGIPRLVEGKFVK